MRQGLAEAELHTQVGLPTLTPTLFLPILVACPSLGQRPTTCPRRPPGSQGPHLAELDVLLVEDAVLDGGLQRLHGRGRTQGHHSEDLRRLMTGRRGTPHTSPSGHFPLPLSRAAAAGLGEGSPAYTIKELEWGGEGIPYFSLGVPGLPLGPGRDLRPSEGR